MTAPAPAGPIELVLGCNRAYLPYAAAVIRSCLDHHAGEHLRFHLLHDGLAERDAQQVRAMAAAAGSQAELHALDPAVVATLPGSRIAHSIVSMRLLLPELLPEVSRVVYLDSDVVVLDSLDELWAADLGGALLGAVHNVVEAPMERHVRALGLDPTRILNSGVLVLALDQMRAAGTVDALREVWEERSGELLWPDQDVLNLAFSDAWAALHPRWNAQNSFYTLRALAERTFGAALVDEAVARPAVRHFEGPSLCKPWHFLCTWPHAREFREAAARTPWAEEVELEDRTSVTRVIHRLPVAWQLPAYQRLVKARARWQRSVG